MTASYAMSETLLPFVVLVFAAATTGAMFRPGVWYDQLTKPSWTPPGWLFGPVWLVLYIMIAVAGWLVWEAQGAGPLVAVWAIQLVANMAWSWIMFGRRNIAGAFADITVLWGSIAAFIVLAWPVSQLAAMLFVPYLVWVSFAAFLNWTIWRLNTS